MIKKLEWDSEIFNLTVGEVNLDKGEIEGAQGFDLIYVKTCDDSNPPIDGFEESFSETKVVFRKYLKTYNQCNCKLLSADDGLINLEELYLLGYESGKFSRFRLDKKFKETDFKKLYRLWIDNSLIREFADDVLLYKQEGVIKGFVTYKIQETIAYIGLIAVAPPYQGQGIGKAIVTCFENILLDKRIKELIIPTQKNNIAACAFYKSLDYEIQDMVRIIHYWKNDTV